MINEINPLPQPTTEELEKLYGRVYEWPKDANGNRRPDFTIRKNLAYMAALNRKHYPIYRCI